MKKPSYIFACVIAQMLFIACSENSGELIESQNVPEPDAKGYVVFNSNNATKIASPAKLKLVSTEVEYTEPVYWDDDNDPETPDVAKLDDATDDPLLETLTRTDYLLPKLPTPPSKLNYVFLGWNTKKDGTGNTINADSVFQKEGCTLYAQWKSDEANQLNINGGEVQYTIKQPGFYQFELWGAQGWNPPSDPNNQYGGRGAYVRGIIEFTAEDLAVSDKVYIHVAGVAAEGSAYGGYGGGGNGANNARIGAGGGSSDIRWGEDTLYGRILVAAGGGGANDASQGGTGVAYVFQKGGFGGGITGGNAEGADPGLGATQTAGGPKPSMNGAAGQWFQGGTFTGANEQAGGGGGGYYGGGSAGQRSNNGGGGGGSSFISGYPECVAITATGATVPNTAEGDVNEDNEIVVNEIILEDPDRPFNDDETDVENYNPIKETIPHTIVIKRQYPNKSIHFSGKTAISELTLFKGEPQYEKTYATQMIAGDQSMPKPSGGVETGHTGWGYCAITYLGDGILHEIVELEEDDIEDIPAEDDI